MDDPLSVTFAALADQTRRAILERLARSDATVGELAAPFAISLPAISKHIATLERAGLITKSRDGQRRNCRVTATPLRNASAWIEDYRHHWEANLDNLTGYLAKLQADPAPAVPTTPEATTPEATTPQANPPSIKEEDR